METFCEKSLNISHHLLGHQVGPCWTGILHVVLVGTRGIVDKPALSYDQDFKKRQK